MVADVTIANEAEDVTSNLDLFVPSEPGKPVLFGYHFRESAGTSGPFRALVKNGSAASGQTLFSIEGDQNKVVSEWFGPNGIESYNGISIVHEMGTFDVTVMFKR